MEINDDSGIYLLDTDDPVDIRKDNVFKAVFTKENADAKKALSKFISALISKEVTIETILTNEPPIDNLRDRQIRFDINCRAGNGELLNIEMSFSPESYESVRLEFHAGKLFIGQDIKGKTKDYNDLKQAYQIAILANTPLFVNNDFLHVFEYYDPVRRVSLNGRTRIITLELSKLGKIVEKPTEKMSVSERWAAYLQYLTDKNKRSKINEILKQEEGIAMANKVLMKISRDEEERARLMRDEKIELDYQSGLSNARKQGIQQGIQQGIKQGSNIERERFLNLLNQGLSVEEIKQRL